MSFSAVTSLALMAIHPAFAISSFSFGARASFAPSFQNVRLSHHKRIQRLGRVVRTRATPPGKGELYSDDELMNILSTHLELFPEEEGPLRPNENFISDPNQSSGDTAEASIPGIHELVLQTLDNCSSSEQDQLRNTIIQTRKPNIRAIASDVDGTLLSSSQDLHPRTQNAVIKAIEQSTVSGGSAPKQKIEFFFPATGKSRKGAADSLGPTIGPLLSNCPGVYLQGLYCVDRDNKVVFERKLPLSAIRAAEDLVKRYGISIIGYDGDNLYTTEETRDVRSLSEIYGEPESKLILDESGHIRNLTEHEPGLHKLLLIDSDEEKLNSEIRDQLELLALEHGATVTQALPNMLELLPSGCSKAFGVRKLCEALGINVEVELLALGDAENDVGMLEMACIGVAVGNACLRASKAADYVMSERNDEGGAGLAIELFGLD